MLCFPRRAWVGPGAVQRLGEEAARVGRRALLVTGRRGLKQAGTADQLVGLLKKAGLGVELFDGAPAEPDVAAVDRARERLCNAGCDLVVEAGGGSALDVGKAAAALALGTAPTVEYQRGLDLPDRGLPHIAVPTTAGTGAEATPNSVLTDPDERVKKSIRGEALLPAACIVDGDLTVSCPPAVTAASGMDALAQAIESYVSVDATPFTEALSLEAVRLVTANLFQAYLRGDDREARAALAEGSFMAGVALANARLGAVHGLAHPLGLLYGLPHGLRRNAPAIAGKYATLLQAMEADPVEKVWELLTLLRLPTRLGPYPDAEWERRILDYAVPTGSSRANPVPVDDAYVRDILRAVCS